SLKEALFPMDARVKPAHDGSRTGRKADKSACVAYFPVDSRNENLPEKCIHQNCASRPGWYAARDFCCAGAACLPLRREEGEPNRPLSVRLGCNRWLQETAAASRSLFWGLFLQRIRQL